MSRPLRRHGPAALILALFVLVLFAPLLFTNRVLASGDILHYFYPYRDYAAAALRAGELPLWNPYIFLGVPFLANPQAAVLYPLHWPLSWLSVTQQIYCSAALHSWIVGCGGYLLLRRWGQSGVAGLIGGLVLAGSGFYGGLLGHINQMNGAAWLPWALWAVASMGDREAATARSLGHRLAAPPFLLGTALLALLVALMLLAGHTQTVFINLVGVGLCVIWPLLRWLVSELRAWRTAAPASLIRRGLQIGATRLPELLGYVLAITLGALLSAAQLLPTLELSSQGLRSGGLSYGEASSFSLSPLTLHWSLLPSYGLRDLGVVFQTLGYTEFVAYLGILGLGLAALGGWQGRGPARVYGLLLAGAGLFLALGRWNPFYFFLYTLLPGFDLFRTPARWMMLYTLGGALLAGVGCDRLLAAHHRSSHHATLQRFQARLPKRFATLSHLAWVPLLILAVALELLAAARALPHSQPTAPQAVYDVRTAPAFLLSDPVRATVHPAAAGRFLSMSTITFDPGDMPDYRRALLEGDPPQLDTRAFQELVIAQKSQEILAPNLPLFWRVPAVDGFDGGVLPLQRYLGLLTLFVPAAELVPDGRLREQVGTVPDAALLALLNVRYLITDKVRDLWLDGVYYDRQIGATLTTAPGQGVSQLQMEAELTFPATHLDIVGYLDGPAALLEELRSRALPAISVEVAGSAGVSQTYTITVGGAAGAQLADGRLHTPLAASSGAQVAYRDVEAGRQEYLVRLALEPLLDPTGVALRALPNSATVAITAASLIDQRTGTFLPLLPSDRGKFRLVHSGDVKIYENLDLLPRAYLATRVIGVASGDEALAYLREPGIVDGSIALVEGLPEPAQEGRAGALRASSAPAAGTSVEMVAYAPERVELRVQSPTAAWLVLSDTYYPGWEATVNGQAVLIRPTNYLFRGVPLPAGDHTVVFHYRPRSWVWGLRLSAAGALLWLLAVTIGWQRARSISAA